VRVRIKHNLDRALIDPIVISFDKHVTLQSIGQRPNDLTTVVLERS
jgi:hypothetical protein